METNTSEPQPDEAQALDDRYGRLTAQALEIAAGVTTRGRRTQLTAEQVDEIRRLRGVVGVTKVARTYHIGPSRVYQIWGEKGTEPAPEQNVRMSPNFAAPEPAPPVSADLRSVVRRRKRGKPAVRRSSRRGSKAEESSSESEGDDSEDSEVDVSDLCERFEEGLAAFRAGCDDPTMVANLKLDASSLRALGEISALKYTRLVRELSTPRHGHPRGVPKPAPAADQSVQPVVSPGGRVRHEHAGDPAGGRDGPREEGEAGGLHQGGSGADRRPDLPPAGVNAILAGLRARRATQAAGPE